MRRVIVPLKEFNHALAAIESRAPLDFVRDLACRLAAAPDCPAAIRIGGMHVLHTRGYGQYPAFSLFYKFDESTIYLTHIEPRDELEGYEDREW